MKLNVNGVERMVTDWLNESLLTVLRDHLGLTGTRFSCGIGQSWCLRKCMSMVRRSTVV